MRNLGLETRFTHVVTPADCGTRKPERKIFQYALDLLGIAVRDCVMIGDNLAAGIEPAMALGLRVFNVEARQAQVYPRCLECHPKRYIHTLNI